MPRKAVGEDVIRPRRRSAAAGKNEIDEERGFAMRILLHSPKDLLAGSLAFAAVSAIVANAMFMQAGHHPAPMFGSGTTMPLTSPQVSERSDSPLLSRSSRAASSDLLQRGAHRTARWPRS